VGSHRSLGTVDGAYVWRCVLVGTALLSWRASATPPIVHGPTALTRLQPAEHRGIAF